VSAADAAEQAVLAALARPGCGPVAASDLAHRLGRPRREVDAALVALAQRGRAAREVDWASGFVLTLWRYRGSR
jgi:hypothetical protein